MTKEQSPNNNENNTKPLHEVLTGVANGDYFGWHIADFSEADHPDDPPHFGITFSHMDDDTHVDPWLRPDDPDVHYKLMLPEEAAALLANLSESEHGRLVLGQDIYPGE